MTKGRRLALGPLLTLALLLALSAPGVRAQTVVVDGQARTAKGLQAMKEAVSKELAAISSELPAEVAAELKSALEAEAAALDEVAKLLADVGGIQGAVRALDREIDQAGKQLAGTQEGAAKPSAPERPTDEDVTRAETEVAKARQAAAEATSRLAEAQARAKAREDAFASAADRIAALAEERTALEQQAPGEGAAPQRTAAAKLTTNELKLRAAELARDHHAALVGRDRKAVELARITEELARARVSLAETRRDLTTSRRNAQREREKAEAAAEAERRRKALEKLDQEPVARAVAVLEILVAEFTEASLHEQGIASASKQALDRSARVRDDVRRRDERVYERLRDRQLSDTARRVFLDEEQERLDRRRRSFDEWREANGPRVERWQREAIRTREQLGALRGRMEDARQQRVAQDEIDVGEGHLPEGVEDDQSKWLRAERDYHEGKARLAETYGPAEIRRLEARWKDASQKLDGLISERLRHLRDTDDACGEVAEVIRETDDLLVLRRFALDDARYWTPDPPPLSLEELEKARADLMELAAEPPLRIAGDGPTARENPLIPWVLGSGVAAAFLFGFVVVRSIARRRRRAKKGGAGEEGTTDEEESGSAKVGAALGDAVVASLPFFLVAAVAGGAGLLLAPRSAPVQGLAVAALALGAVWIVRKTLGALVASCREHGREVTPDATRCMRAIRREMWGLALLVVLATYLEITGYERLAALVRIALDLWFLVFAAWMTRRSSAILELLPGPESEHGSTALRGVFRSSWPMLSLFIAGVLVLELLGYRAAAVFLGTRCVLGIGILVTAFLVIQSLNRVIGAYTADDEDYSLSRADRALVSRRAALSRRVLSSLATVVVLAAAVITLSFVVRLSWPRWVAIGAFEVTSGRGDEPGTTLRDLARGGAWALALIWIAGVVRDFIQVGRSQQWLATGSRYAISTLVFYAVVALGVVIGLKTVGVSLAELGWLLAPAGVAIGFGLTELLSNFVSGFILFLERPVQVGDIITVGDIEGDVRKISIRATVVTTRDGVSIIIPNKTLITSEVVNWSHGDLRTRLRVSAGVAYGSDVELVTKLLLEVANDQPRVLRRPPPEVSFLAFGESELQFELLAWLSTPDLTVQRLVRSDINSAIDAAFRENGVEIPFPQRDLHVRSGLEPITDRRGA